LHSNRSWTVAIYDATRLPTIAVGGVAAAVLLLGFFASEQLLGRLDSGSLRLTVIHCLLAAYVPTAYVYFQKRSFRTVEELRTTIRCTPGSFERFAESVGHYSWWGLALAGLRWRPFTPAPTSSCIPCTPASFGQCPVRCRWNWRSNG
jgi:hypothetical protein